jgi:hypothetical protein
MLTVPALLAHVVVMLVATSALTIVNLLVGPRVWWSLAILVIWLALVIIHGIGVGSRTLLFEEEDDAPAPPARRSQSEPIGPPIPGWLTLPRRNSRPEPVVPATWELRDDASGPSWPERTVAGPPAPAPVEKVSWRAATDVAWLRRPKPITPDDADPPETRKASS